MINKVEWLYCTRECNHVILPLRQSRNFSKITFVFYHRQSDKLSRELVFTVLNNKGPTKTYFTLEFKKPNGCIFLVPWTWFVFADGFTLLSAAALCMTENKGAFTVTKKLQRLKPVDLSTVNYFSGQTPLERTCCLRSTWFISSPESVVAGSCSKFNSPSCCFLVTLHLIALSLSSHWASATSQDHTYPCKLFQMHQTPAGGGKLHTKSH